MSPVDRPDPDALLSPAEVGVLFAVTSKTVSRWADSGKLTARKTLGGHRRFRAAEVLELLDEADAGGPVQPSR